MHSKSKTMQCKGEVGGTDHGESLQWQRWENGLDALFHDGICCLLKIRNER